MLITTPLKQIQIEAREWLSNRETIPAFGVNGGFFCDDPGMGKTLSLLSLICTQTPNATTLVVAPSNVIDVWKSEIQLHTKISMSNIFTYHGPKRKSVAIRLQRALKNKTIDQPIIVLTSYGIVRNECIIRGPNMDNITEDTRFFKQESIFNEDFYRIILDEAHFIKDNKSLSSLSVIQLKSQKKWVVTATPLSNHLDEDFSYFRFLGLIWTFQHWRAIMPATKDSISGIFSCFR